MPPYLEMKSAASQSSSHRGTPHHRGTTPAEACPQSAALICCRRVVPASFHGTSLQLNDLKDTQGTPRGSNLSDRTRALDAVGLHQGNELFRRISTKGLENELDDLEAIKTTRDDMICTSACSQGMIYMI